MKLSDRNLLIKIKNDNCLLEFRHHLTATDRSEFARVLSWSPALLGLMAKQGDTVITWLNKLSRSELAACRDLWDWPVNMLDRLYAEPQHLLPIYWMWDMIDDHESYFKQYFRINDHQLFHSDTMLDAWSQGQISSKAWLCNTASVLGLKLGRAWVLCGWLGTLSYFLLVRREKLGIDHMRSFDINPDCRQLSELLNLRWVMDEWKFKSATLDVNSAIYDEFSYLLLKHDGTSQMVCESADTVINTSCDHMGDDRTWWDRIPSGKLVILQNNDWYENDQHNNSVATLREFKKQYPMSQLLFEGELDCTLYTRFMLIGRK